MFTLILRLSKIEEPKKIIALYLEALYAICPEMSFTHSGNALPEKKGISIPLKTTLFDFGYIDIHTNSRIVPSELEALLHSSTQIISLLLENRKHQDLLWKEKKLFKGKLNRQIKNLQIKEEHYRALTENTEDILIRVNKDYTIIFVNSAVEKVTSFIKKNILGKQVKDLKFIIENTQKWVDHLSEVFEHKKTLRDEFRMSGPLGNRVLDVRLIPEFNAKCEVTSIICSGRDITELKQNEEELIKARQKAEESDHLKSAFLANMSHEIRTPLNGILGFSQLLKDKDLRLEKRQLFSEIINNNGKQLLRIISDIIDISKIEAGQIKFEENAVDILPMFDLLYESYKNELVLHKKPQIELIIENESEQAPICLLTDEIRLKQVLQNLIGNAIKFTHTGSITFGMKVLESQIQFFVRDTGIGLSDNHKELIFDRFRQANDSITREYGGTGLGLAIARNLIELMGGKIWVESEEKKGTSFYFTLPLKLTECKPQPKIEPPKVIQPIKLKGKRILVVEDDKYNFDYIEAILEDTEAKIIHVDNGFEAIALCKKINPDLILMDIRLPVLNGSEAILAIKQILPKMKIIVLTANIFGEDRIKYLNMGCADYISKPVSRELLLESVIKNIRNDQILK